MDRWSFDFIEDLERMQHGINRLLGTKSPFGWTAPFSRISFLPARAARGYPLLNVAEDSDNFYVDAMAPGLDPGKIDISITGNQLVISGEKAPLPKSVKSEKVHRNERAAGKFIRSLTLSGDVESKTISASYVAGILKVKLPKSEAAKPKKIDDKVS